MTSAATTQDPTDTQNLELYVYFPQGKAKYLMLRVQRESGDWIVRAYKEGVQHGGDYTLTGDSGILYITRQDNSIIMSVYDDDAAAANNFGAAITASSDYRETTLAEVTILTQILLYSSGTFSWECDAFYLDVPAEIYAVAETADMHLGRKNGMKTLLRNKIAAFRDAAGRVRFRWFLDGSTTRRGSQVPALTTSYKEHDFKVGGRCRTCRWKLEDGHMGRSYIGQDIIQYQPHWEEVKVGRGST